MTQQTSKIRRYYERRDALEKYKQWNPIGLYPLLVRQERQRALVKLLRNRFSHEATAQLRCLEVGCGVGDNLLELISLGFSPGCLRGIELMPTRAQIARSRLPTAVNIDVGDAAEIDLPRDSFDIVYQAVVFSSILQETHQQALAARMWQWLKPGGGLLWYDMIWNNPFNENVRRVPVTRIKTLFPGKVTSRRITLSPPIGRLLAPMGPLVYGLANSVPLLRSHVFCWIQK